MSRVALLIGIERYKHLSELGTPYQDVKLLGGKLRQLGFQIIELGQGSPAHDSTAIREAVAALRRRIEELPAAHTRRRTCALVYFAGHGVILGGETHLVGATADPSSESALRTGSVPLDEIVRSLGVRLDVPKVLLIDACQSHATSLAFVQQPYAVAVLPGDMVIDFATHPGEAALEGVAHSAYALALAEHLDDPVTIGDVLVSVTARVRDLTGQRQSPLTYASLGVRLVIAGGREDADIAGSTGVLSNATVARLRHRIVLFQSRDPVRGWGWYAILLHEGMERRFARAIVAESPLDLRTYGVLLAVAYGEQPSDELKRYLKARYAL